MQSFLGDYLRSRKSPNEKFIRAVNSFLNQIYKNCELVIVSDGCKETKLIYNEKFKNYDNIKFVYLEQETSQMYYSDSEKTYYRGYPRQIGVDLANGDIVSYLDSDDYLLPQASEILKYYWQKYYNNCVFALTNTWFDNYISDYKKYEWFYIEQEKNSIEGLDSYWNKISSIDNTIFVFTPWCLSHKKNISPKWEDIFSESISEDNYFIQKLLYNYPYKRFAINEAYYVRCNYYDKEHSKFLWDV